MLAPPGYAKIVSTPSRSRQATRISLPDIAGPTSGRGADFFFSVLSIVLLMALASMDWWMDGLLDTMSNARRVFPSIHSSENPFIHFCLAVRRGQQKTHDRFQPWVFV